MWDILKKRCHYMTESIKERQWKRNSQTTARRICPPVSTFNPHTRFIVQLIWIMGPIMKLEVSIKDNTLSRQIFFISISTIMPYGKE